ncbi:MBL fold metallo-hydrolase [Blautia wexlerae]|uniref:MBL fold metallo-hydrolase n=1 Tax=Blautia wexlerae TaxID=418240 RepID=UPI001A9B36FE|nr:MBL fold metallo-hydrolase [Blautia wexlerae]
MKYIQKIRPQELQYIIIGHVHQDHIGMIPTLYARGKCNAKIIVPKGSISILKEMWLDSSFINCRDVEVINLKNDRNYEPFYTEDVVYKTLEYIEEIDSDKIVSLSDELAIRYTDAGHILLSKQCEVYINGGSRTRKILFSSDLGNISTQDTRVFVENFKPVTSANIAIMECTYASKERQCTKETYKKDVTKIKSVVEQYCIDNNSRVLIPSFSLDRTPYILWILYSLFGKDENFKIPILIDSPLANRLLDCYSSILDGEKKELFDEIMSWNNIKRVIQPESSKAAIADKGAKIILSSSGMLTAGRSVKWTQSILPNENDCILFMGYSGENTLAWKIKYGKDHKTININGKPYKNKAQIYDLKSFSSHMQRNEMLNYYKSINCEKIYLVHSDSNKIEFKHDLENAIADCLKSTKVVAVNSGTKISL